MNIQIREHGVQVTYGDGRREFRPWVEVTEEWVAALHVMRARSIGRPVELRVDGVLVDLSEGRPDGATGDGR